ncbi:unnamed protein product [Hydatigera taeniaeformis]|uniref:Ovule protein n=1 Tax=Hydatigena taeniaeformis TaxID=6205 RepID=A0A0R3X8D3_HYDTA|nr:unnamed protein product [Hydatigera taeniaeformis]
MQAAGEHVSSETNQPPQSQKGKRKHQRKSKKDVYTGEQTRIRRDSDQSSVKNETNDSASNLTIGNELGNPSSSKPNLEKAKGRDDNGFGMWNVNEEFSRGHPSNPHATVCPVALTANAIFELDEE